VKVYKKTLKDYGYSRNKEFSNKRLPET
jgi:hypothetical protein